MSARVVLVIVLTVLGAGGALLSGEWAEASFPGQNGLIAFTTYTCEIQGGESSEGDCLGARIAVAHPRRPERRRVLRCDDSACLAGNPRWSPDGKRLLYDTGYNEIYVARSDGSGARRVVKDRPEPSSSSVNDPAWSPNGRRLVFTRDIGTSSRYEPRLFVKRLSGGPEEQVIRGYGKEADWSSRNVIAFSVRQSSFYDIFVVRPNGRGLRRVTYRGKGSGPSWSPNGRLLAIQREIKGQPNIVVIDPRGRTRRVLTRRGGSNPVWSPDGKRIAFTRNADVYSVSARGRDLRRLLPRDVDTFEFDWQPRPRRR